MKSFLKLKRGEIINLGVFAVSLIPVILYLFIVYQRLGFPFDLEWGEGAGINQIYRILSGEQLYVEPTLEFAPLVYTPFYYWLASILSRLGMQVVMAARSLSLIASLGAVGIIAWLVSKETGKLLPGWIAGAIYLACFALSDGFFDLVRVDSLYVLLLLISLVILRVSKNQTGMIVAGLSIALGFFTKQSTLIVYFPLVIYLLCKDWKKAWPLLAAIIMGVLLPFCWINLKSDGWFVYYALQLPREHGYSLLAVVDYWVGDLFRPLGIAIGFGMFYSLDLWIRGNLDKDSHPIETAFGEVKDNKAFLSQQVVFYFLFAAGAIGAGWVTRASNGGGPNNVMSAYAALAILFGFGFDKARVLINNKKLLNCKFEFLLAGIVAVQFVGLIYNPFNFIPATGEIQANEILIEKMREVEDPPWVPFRSQLPRLAEKPTSIHAVNLFELTGYFKGDVLPVGRELVEKIRENVCYQNYGLIVLDQPVPWISEQISSSYQLDDTFSFLASERRSELLEWQGGFEAFYLPREDYDLSSCLDTLIDDGEK